MKRSNEPMFWLLFGAGGMLSALCGAVLILTTGILVPQGVFLSTSTMDYSHVHQLATNPLGKIAIFAVIVLFLWHSIHRMAETLRDAAGFKGEIVPLALRCVALIATFWCGWLLATI
jgi:fumarate reductase subunit D